MAGRGRPTKYKPEYCAAADKYIAECVDKVETFHKTIGEKSDSYDRILKVELPTHCGFAIYLHVNESSLYEWAKKHEEFSKALDRIKTEQEKRLLNKGVGGEYNSTIAKLILSSNHGYAEKQETKVSGELDMNPERKKEIKQALTDI